MSSTVGTVVTLDEVYAEGTDGQVITIDLADWDAAPAVADIVSITGVLRSRDTDEIIFGDETPATLYPDGRASLPGVPGEEEEPPATPDDRVLVTLTAADMVAKGSRELQTRELTLTITHSTDKVFHCGVVFRLLNQRDVA